MISYRGDHATPRVMSSDDLEVVAERVAEKLADRAPAPPPPHVEILVDLVVRRVLERFAESPSNTPLVARAVQGMNHRLKILTGVESTGQIIRAVSEVSGVTPSEIVGLRRERRIVVARHVAIALTRNRLGFLSYPEIGRAFGKRDHTSMMYAVNKVARERQNAPNWYADLYTKAEAALEAGE